jgi:putative mRNA 3-end processing factor
VQSGSQSGSWIRALGDCSDAFASGWMQLRGARRRRGVDRGFVLSDHADWPGLQAAITATGADRVIVTHGYEAVMVRWLQQQGLQAGSFQTEYGERDEDRDNDRGEDGVPRLDNKVASEQDANPDKHPMP